MQGASAPFYSMIKVIKRFYGAEDGKIYPRWFEVGEVIDGDLANSALIQGVAEDTTKKKPEKNKDLGNAPRNKQYLSSPPGHPSQKKMFGKRKD